MLTVGSPLSSAFAALNAVTTGQVQPAAAPAVAHTGNALTGASRLMLSSAASDALLRFSGREAAAMGAEMARAPLDTIASNRPSGVADNIPPERLAWLNSLGADRWEVREPATIDDAEFETRVLESLYRNGSAKLSGFAEARDNGSLTIQRAADVPELGYKSFQVTLYKDDEVYGGVGFSVCNSEAWMALRESGTYAGTGSVAGVDYVVTWPMPLSADDSDPGIYAAA